MIEKKKIAGLKMSRMKKLMKKFKFRLFWVFYPFIRWVTSFVQLKDKGER